MSGGKRFFFFVFFSFVGAKRIPGIPFPSPHSAAALQSALHFKMSCLYFVVQRHPFLSVYAFGQIHIAGALRLCGALLPFFNAPGSHDVRQ
jgi:hypothetical protein